jgi:diadenosine tetraphosphate (Ap4A) HIT family hydrolase
VSQDAVAGCPLCEQPGGELVFGGPMFRLVRVTDEADFPAFWRLIWGRHATEFSQLRPDERATCTEALAACERTVIEHLAPAKINLASLGNQVAHLHWHIVARFAWDSHFPRPIWVQPLRPVEVDGLARLALALPALDQALARCLAPWSGPQHS